MIDADELAKYQAVGWQLRKENDTLRAALEKAQGELNQALDERQANFIMCGEIAAERDSARALLGEARPWICGCDISNDQISDLRARIDKELAR